MCVCVSVWVCAFVYVCVYLFVCVCVCVTYVCVFVWRVCGGESYCACVSEWVRARQSERERARDCVCGLKAVWVVPVVDVNSDAYQFCEAYLFCSRGINIYANPFYVEPQSFTRMCVFACARVCVCVCEVFTMRYAKTWVVTEEWMSNEWWMTRGLSDSHSVTTEELLVNRLGDYCICYWVTNDE